jgi:hypothetical protein
VGDYISKTTGSCSTGFDSSAVPFQLALAYIPPDFPLVILSACRLLLAGFLLGLLFIHEDGGDIFP